MNKEKENSFLEGSVFKALVRFAIPVLGAFIILIVLFSIYK